MPDALLQDAAFWVAVSFVIFVALVGRKAYNGIGAFLDQRGERIRSELDEAQRLRESAQTLLADYHNKRMQAAKEAEDIVAHAREDVERMRRKAAADFQITLKRREAAALERIALVEAAALVEVRKLTVNVAIAATRKLMVERLSSSDPDLLVDRAIAELPRLLH
ncbi:ATP synthase subunit b 3 [uncultured Gammaproteobacteria bacterium]